jgi:ABC-type Mn2+/Zn2+ transport system permease subunit
VVNDTHGKRDVTGALIDSCALSHESQLAGLAIAGLLSLTGVHIVTRERIFVGAALAQSSMLGITVGIRLEAASWLAWLAPQSLHTALAVVFAVAASLLISGSTRMHRATEEATTAWIFLAGTSFSFLLVAHGTLGLAQVHRILASTVLGATALNCAILGAACLFAATFAARRHDDLFLLASDPDMACAVGMQVSRWQNGLAIWLGAAVAVSVQVSGVAYTFGCLVLPALTARSLCTEMKQVLALAPAIGVATSLFGFMLANHFDLPSAQTVVALLCVFAALGAMAGRPRIRR